MCQAAEIWDKYNRVRIEGKDMVCAATRRVFIKRCVYVVAVAIAGCDRSRPSQQKPDAAKAQPGVPPERVPCNDLAGLAKDEVARRKALKYTDRAPDSSRNCGGCAHLQLVPGSDSPCKRCSVIAGPVHINGWCSAWLQRSGAAG